MAGRILVAVKRVVDYNARVRVKPDKVRAAAAGSGGGTEQQAQPSSPTALIKRPFCLPSRRGWTSAMSRCP